MSTRSMGNLTLNVIANTGSFEEGANRTERALEKMNKAVQRQKSEFESLIDKIDPVVAELNRLDKMQTQLEKHREKGFVDESAFTNYTNQLKAMQREVIETNSAFAVQQREFAKLINQIDPTISKMAELDRMQDQLQQGFKAGLVDEAEYNRLNSVLGKSREAIDGTATAQNKANAELKQQQTELQNILRQLDPVTAKLADLDAQNRKLSEGLKLGLIDQSQYDQSVQKLHEMRSAVDGTTDAQNKATAELKSQEAELQRLSRVFDPITHEIKELDKAQDQLKAGLSAGLINQAEYEKLSAQVTKSRNALDSLNDKARQTEMSQKQLNFALRGVPAQFTDIFVSLAAGQNPMLVFLQQGGQLKDMFGGVGPAAKALTSYIVGMINPLSIAGAGLSVLALAYYQGSIEADKFRQAIVFTGNAAGVTTDSLAEMAKRIDDVSGTQRQASAAIAEAASTGKFTSEQLEMVSRAAVLMENTVGKAISDTVKEFESLAKDPAKAVVDLNEKYNFLTADIYEQIAALQEQGKTQDASTLAMNAYADATEQRTQEILSNLGYIEQAWKAIKEGSTEAWDSVLDVGRTDTIYERLEDMDAQIEKARQQGTRTLRGKPLPGADLASLEAGRRLLLEQIVLEELGAEEQQRKAVLNKESITSQQQINKLLDDAKTKEQKKADAIKEYNANLAKIREADPNSALLSPASVAKGLAVIEEKFKETTKNVSDDSAKVYMMQLAQQEATLREQLGTNQKLGEAQKQLVKFEQQLSDIKEKKTLTAQQKSLLAEESAIRTQLQRNVELEREIKSREQINRLTAYQQNLQSEVDAQRQQYGDALANFGMGDRARERMGERNNIERDVQRGRDRSTSDFATGSITQEEYDSQIEMLDDQLKTRIEMMEDYYAREDEMRGDWTNGWNEAWANWSDQVSDIASQMEGVFSSAFGGLEDALYDFVTTGNFSLSEMLRNMAEETLRMLIRVGAQKMINWALEKTMGASAAAGYIAQVTGQSTAGVMLAGINAFASTAAIPIVGPGLAPAALAAATAATSPLAAGAIAAAGSTLAGMAHSGLDYIPKEGTWLLDKGERVLSPRQNQDLTNFLSSTPAKGSSGRDVAITVPLTINGNPDDRTLQLIKKAANDGAAMAYQRISGDLATGRGDVSRAVTVGWSVSRRKR